MKAKIKKSITKRPINKLKEGESLSSKPQKHIPIDNGKKVVVTRVKYSDRDIESVLRVMAHIGCIRDEMVSLKNSEFYSAKLDDLFDLYYRSKLSTVFKQNSKHISDLIFEMTKRLSNLCQNSYEITLQPEITQQRFEQGMKDLMVLCGVTLRG